MTPTPLISTETIAQFGKVAVLMGGWAAEREVSLNSGKAVLAGLLEKGVDAHKVDAGRDVLDVLRKEKFDRVFNILHGRGGEDGVLQGALDILQIPYTGCGVMASSITMDKLMTKRIWTGSGLPTPAFEILTPESDFEKVVDKLGLPVMVKPAQEGSSIGMSKVSEAHQLKPAFEKAAKYDQIVFAEQWVIGKEFTIAMLGDEVLPPIRLEANADFYDYDAKYVSNDTQYHCPCGLGNDSLATLRTLARTAFETIGGKGWGRVDVMQDNMGTFWLIEVNTVPGMTDHSLVPMAAKQHGMSFADLTLEILKTSWLKRSNELSSELTSSEMSNAG
ncbi:MAG TPA: D-alanine--D-alanine ligase [Leucothrix sp.]|nr:D-alanine--D-alanine ligase [Leucothrix sp.]